MFDLLSQNYFALFFIISIGIILGHIKIKGISLDISAVIFVALVMGHYGIVINPDFQKVGLSLFIFTIGIQSGPGFFESFKKRGRDLFILVMVLVITGGLLTVLFTYVFHLKPQVAVGLLSGALTSTPGLAAAIESTHSSLASIGYGIGYPFGVVGVILFIRLLPRVLRINLRDEEMKIEKEIKSTFPAISNQNFIVENSNIDGKSIGELEIRTMTKATISRIMHDGVAVTPDSDTLLNLGDRVKAVGSKEALERIKILIGSPTEEDIPLSKGYDVQWVLVTNKEVVNKKLAQLNLLEYFNATVTRIRRSGIDLPPTPNSNVRFGDRLMIATDKERMRQVAKLLGNNEKLLSGTDFLPIALGIVFGVLLGRVSWPLWGGTTFHLGITGGVLITALVLSRIGKTGPIIWSMSGPANQLLRQVGLLLFLATVGTEAGVHLVETIVQYGPKLFLIGIVLTLTPMIVSVIIGRWVFKLDFLTLLGVITGGMTSTPGLAAIDPMTDSNAPKIAYANVYPIALVGIILVSQILARTLH